MSGPDRVAWGHGLVTVARDGAALDAWFPEPALGPQPDDAHPTALEAEEREDALRGVRLEAVAVEVDLDAPIASVPDAFLRLHLLSHRLVAPNTIGLEGLHAVLPVTAWTTAGPMRPAEAALRRPALVRAGVQVQGLDRIPRMTDYVLPDRVRIADAARVRLGAHLAPGTTVMPAGFVNYNAGTLGASMVEGRISQGVVLGDGSDLGGGASTMGVLSGGGRERVSIGRRSLVGANAGVGIALGDDCVVESGLYLTSGTKLTLRGDGDPRVLRARDLSGADGLLFRRDSLTGGVEALPRASTFALNPLLHA